MPTRAAAIAAVAPIARKINVRLRSRGVAMACSMIASWWQMKISQNGGR
jgi:hypothetical protein